jgi:hypothetical protein
VKKIKVTAEQKQQAIKLLSAAILEDGKGKDGRYYRDYGKYLWQPKTDRVFVAIAKDKTLAFSINSNSTGIDAYLYQGQTTVCHHGQDRHNIYGKILAKEWQQV